MGLGSGIPDPGVKKAPDSGSSPQHAINNCIQVVPLCVKKIPVLASPTVPVPNEKLTYVWSLPIRRELEVKHVTPKAHAAILILGNLSAIFLLNKWQNFQSKLVFSICSLI
jgi:hypothetical protein